MRELNFIEIEAEHIELLPTRETMNVFGSNWAAIVATNSSLALNAASLGSLASSAAVQTIVVDAELIRRAWPPTVGATPRQPNSGRKGVKGMIRPEVSTADLDAQMAVALPRRETLSCQFACVNVVNVVGVNLAISVNAATINSQANALAMQYLAGGPDALTETRRRVCCSGAPAVLRSNSQSTPEHTRAMNPTTADHRATPSQAEEPRWRQAAGLQLLGQVQGSGMRDPAYLVRRADDQVVQLSELLHLVVVHAGPVSSRRRRRRGRQREVRPDPHDRGAGPPRHDPSRAARPGAAGRDGGTDPPGAGPAAAGPDSQGHPPPAPPDAGRGQDAATDVLAARRRGRPWSPWSSPTSPSWWAATSGWPLTEVLATPTTALLIYGLLVASAVVHELGHAAACRYGGAEPGEIGVGIYIVFPAFYTDVTDSYRLGRAGRVRTDLGGLYFNAMTVVVFALLYVATGSGLWLLTALGLQLQMLQQLIPVVRFDGYYVLSDLAGVPDLFARVGPVLRSLRPGHPPDPRVTELRPQARRFVTGWVLVVVPLLTGALAWAIWHAPDFFAAGRAAHPAAAAGLRRGLGSAATGLPWPWPSCRSH